jgi:hypothetical protein
MIGVQRTFHIKLHSPLSNKDDFQNIHQHLVNSAKSINPNERPPTTVSSTSGTGKHGANTPIKWSVSLISFKLPGH